MRWHPYATTCDACARNVLAGGAISWFHCTVCADGDFDLCHGCARGAGACPGGHALVMLATGDEGGDMRIVARPAVAAPEMCAERGGDGACARAERASWADGDSALRFPAGAELRGVRTAFKAENARGDEVEFCWGVYAGAGGMFERSLVRFVAFL